MTPFTKKTLSAFSLFFLIFPLFARDITITVLDADLDLPLEGATVRSWDGTEHVCDEDGNAVISAPDGRQVVIQAAYPGYETGRMIIPISGDSFTVGLRLSGIMESRELVIEAARPGVSETRTGRSVAVSGRDIAQTGEIGIIEDVMSSVKLLPGVGYTGLFNAQPSIRGGDPGDMSAALDGFYIMNPYHWGGGFLIFDPRMVQSAQLSHGVFSARYGHTISGLLEITTKKPSTTDTQFELGVNTSAANAYLSIPLAGRGGVLFMGRVTYYDPVVGLAKMLSNVIDELSVVNYIRVAPYIRSGTVTGNYRFYDNIELAATGFFGMDGVGVTYENSTRTNALKSDSDIVFDWTNYQGFINAALNWNPRGDMLMKFRAGTGYHNAVVDGNFKSKIINKSYSNEFNDKYGGLVPGTPDSYSFETESVFKGSDLMFNAQGRIDYDWELKNGLLISAGVQEMFTQYSNSGDQKIASQKWYKDLTPDEQENLLGPIVNPSDPKNFLSVSFQNDYNPSAKNMFFTTSGYGLAEYHTPGSRFKTELGLRIDHFYLTGKGFSIQSTPALNPRFNVDFNVFKNRGVLQSFDISAGTGLFSSVNDTVTIAEEKYGIDKLKPNRSWTSVFGTRLEFPEGLNFNIEFYYKYVFDRTYIPISFGIEEMDVSPKFDGEGRVWGIDLMLQKLQSRYWDGWLTYSYTWAKYRDPGGTQDDAAMGISGGNRGDDWYFPQYHRFHNLNLVFNFKPIPRINIYTRLGLASGALLRRRIGNKPISYPVYLVESGEFIEMFYWPSVRDDNNRTTPSIPLDIKFSIFGKNEKGKARYELYIAVENALALLYTSQGNTSFNQYTGEVETGSNAANYEIPIPIPSFGFKISY